jgi:hypothetical protein
MRTVILRLDGEAGSVIFSSQHSPILLHRLTFLPRSIRDGEGGRERVDFDEAFNIQLRPAKGIAPLTGDHITRRSAMKKLLSAMMMAMFLVSVTGVAFADEMKGDHKDMGKKEEKKAEKKEEKKKK